MTRHDAPGHAPAALSIAIVGAGPSGCYAAQAILRAVPGARAVVLDRLPVPYGLVRYGVAADHQGTKAVSKQFERLFAQAGAEFLGDVEVGRDLELDDLREAFDVVVLATGLHRDRPLGVPGDDLEGVVGSGRVTRLLNAHPDEVERRAAPVRLGEHAVVIGMGNVALDLVRLIVKRAEDLDGSDVDDESHAVLRAGTRTVVVASRSGVDEARFDPVMMRELGQTPGAVFSATGLRGDESSPRAEAVRSLPGPDLVARPRVRVELAFGAAPVAIRGDGHVEAVELRRADGTTETRPATGVVTAIGFDADPDGPAARWRELALEAGGAHRLGPGLYCAGWLRSGPRGTIPEHRAAAKELAAELASALERGELEPGRPGLSALPSSARARAVGFDHWRRVDERERAAAAPGRVRAKLRTRAALLEGAESAERVAR